MKHLETKKQLKVRAAELFPGNEDAQEKWVKNILWMRSSSKAGFALDKTSPKLSAEATRPVLHRSNIEPIRTVVSPPEPTDYVGVDRVFPMKRK